MNKKLSTAGMVLKILLLLGFAQFKNLHSMVIESGTIEGN